MGKTKDLTVRSYTLVNMLKQLATDTANGVTPDPANYSGRGGGDWGGRGRGRGRGRGSSGRGGRGGGDRSSGGRSVICFSSCTRCLAFDHCLGRIVGVLLAKPVRSPKIYLPITCSNPRTPSTRYLFRKPVFFFSPNVSYGIIPRFASHVFVSEVSV